MREFNILVDALPESVEIGGETYPINSGFRTGILFEMMLSEGDIQGEAEKGLQAFALWYGTDALRRFRMEDVDEAVQKLIWFYRCGEDDESEDEKDSDQEKESEKVRFKRRIYDFDVDAPKIYAAFLSQYRIDLNSIPDLHWWKFCALFSSLNEEQEITKIMGYRAVDLAKIKSKAERERLAKLQARYALPNRMTVEEKAAAAGALFGGMFG